MVYIPHNEEDDEEEEEEKNSKKRKKMKSKEKRKKEKAKKQNVPINQNDEVKLQPGDLVITGSADANIKIWSLHSGECFHVRSFFPFGIYSIYSIYSIILNSSYGSFELIA